MKLTGRQKSRIAAAGVACAATLGAAIFIAPSANAATNRRVCFYSQVNNVTDEYNNVIGHEAEVLNYKKEGSCPVWDGTAAVNKTTCEYFGKEMGVSYDPCDAELTKDDVYQVYWYTNGKSPVFNNAGHY